jgi:hypothetical protein
MRIKLKKARKLEHLASKLKKTVKFLKKRLSSQKIKEKELELKRAELKDLLIKEEIAQHKKEV